MRNFPNLFTGHSEKKVSKLQEAISRVEAQAGYRTLREATQSGERWVKNEFANLAGCLAHNQTNRRTLEELLEITSLPHYFDLWLCLFEQGALGNILLRDMKQENFGEVFIAALAVWSASDQNTMDYGVEIWSNRSVQTLFTATGGKNMQILSVRHKAGSTVPLRDIFREISDFADMSLLELSYVMKHTPREEIESLHPDLRRDLLRYHLLSCPPEGYKTNDTGLLEEVHCLREGYGLWRLNAPEQAAGELGVYWGPAVLAAKYGARRQPVFVQESLPTNKNFILSSYQGVRYTYFPHSSPNDIYAVPCYGWNQRGTADVRRKLIALSEEEDKVTSKQLADFFRAVLRVPDEIERLNLVVNLNLFRPLNMWMISSCWYGLNEEEKNKICELMDDFHQNHLRDTPHIPHCVRILKSDFGDLDDKLTVATFEALAKAFAYMPWHAVYIVDHRLLDPKVIVRAALYGSFYNQIQSPYAHFDFEALCAKFDVEEQTQTPGMPKQKSVAEMLSTPPQDFIGSAILAVNLLITLDFTSETHLGADTCKQIATLVDFNHPAATLVFMQMLKQVLGAEHFHIQGKVVLILLEQVYVNLPEPKPQFLATLVHTFVHYEVPSGIQSSAARMYPQDSNLDTQIFVSALESLQVQEPELLVQGNLLPKIDKYLKLIRLLVLRDKLEAGEKLEQIVLGRANIPLLMPLLGKGLSPDRLGQLLNDFEAQVYLAGQPQKESVEALARKEVGILTHSGIWQTPLPKGRTLFPEDNFDILRVISQTNWPEVQQQFIEYQVEPYQPTRIPEQRKLQELKLFIYLYEQGYIPQFSNYIAYQNARQVVIAATFAAGDRRLLTQAIKGDDFYVVLPLARKNRFIWDHSLRSLPTIQGLQQEDVSNPSTLCQGLAVLLQTKNTVQESVTVWLSYDQELFWQVWEANLAAESPSSELANYLVGIALQKVNQGSTPFPNGTFEHLSDPQLQKEKSAELLDYLARKLTRRKLEAFLPDLHIALIAEAATGRLEEVSSRMLATLALVPDQESFLAAIKRIVDTCAEEIDTLIEVDKLKYYGSTAKARKGQTIDGREVHVLTGGLNDGEILQLRLLVTLYTLYLEFLWANDPAQIPDVDRKNYCSAVKGLELLYELNLINNPQLKPAINLLRKIILKQLAHLAELVNGTLDTGFVLESLKEMPVVHYLPSYFWLKGIEEMNQAAEPAETKEVAFAAISPWHRVTDFSLPSVANIVYLAEQLEGLNRRSRQPASDRVPVAANWKETTYQGRRIVLEGGPAVSLGGRGLVAGVYDARKYKMRERLTQKALAELGQIEQRFNQKISSPERTISEPSRLEAEYIVTRMLRILVYVVEQNPRLFADGDVKTKLRKLHSELALAGKMDLTDRLGTQYYGRSEEEILRKLGNPVLSWVLMLSNPENQTMFLKQVREQPQNFLLLIKYMVLAVVQNFLGVKYNEELALMIADVVTQDIDQNLEIELNSLAQDLCADHNPPTQEQIQAAKVRKLLELNRIAAEQYNPESTAVVRAITSAYTTFVVAGEKISYANAAVAAQRQLAGIQENLGTLKNKRSEAIRRIKVRFLKYSMVPVVLTLLLTLFASIDFDPDDSAPADEDELSLQELGEYYAENPPESLNLLETPVTIKALVIHNGLDVSEGMLRQMVVPYGSGETLTEEAAPIALNIERVGNVSEIKVLPERSFVYTMYSERTMGPSDWSRVIDKLILVGHWEEEPYYDRFGNLIISYKDVGKQIVIVEIENPDYENLGNRMFRFSNSPIQVNPANLYTAEERARLLAASPPELAEVLMELYSKDVADPQTIERVVRELQRVFYSTVITNRYYSLTLPSSDSSFTQMLQVVLGEIGSFYCSVAAQVTAELNEGATGAEAYSVNGLPFRLSADDQSLMLTHLGHRQIVVGNTVIDNTPGVIASGSDITNLFANPEDPEPDLSGNPAMALLASGTLPELYKQHWTEPLKGPALALAGLTVMAIIFLIRKYLRVKRPHIAAAEEYQTLLAIISGDGTLSSEQIKEVANRLNQLNSIELHGEPQLQEEIIKRISRIEVINQSTRPATARIADLIANSAHYEVPPQEEHLIITSILLILSRLANLSESFSSRVLHAIAKSMKFSEAEGKEFAIKELTRLVLILTPEIGVPLILDPDSDPGGIDVINQPQAALNTVIAQTQVTLAAMQRGEPILPAHLSDAMAALAIRENYTLIIAKLLNAIANHPSRQLNQIGVKVLQILALLEAK